MLLGFISDLTVSASILLIICLLAVCLFEAINGFKAPPKPWPRLFKTIPCNRWWR